jgi:A/G-specific adenine glycosylase
VVKFQPAKIRSAILLWGKDNYQSYPWRELNNPWLGLVAEILLQRTNARHVELNWKWVAENYPDPESALNVSPEELVYLDRKFGLGRRAKTVFEVAQFLDLYDYYPNSYEDLTNIYGIGHYTASAYLSLHLKTRAILMDSNIARWLSRLTGIEKPKDLRRHSDLWEVADQLTPSRDFKNFNYAMLDFTMQICTPRNPKCKACPLGLQRLCRYAEKLAGDKK